MTLNSKTKWSIICLIVSLVASYYLVRLREIADYFTVSAAIFTFTFVPISAYLENPPSRSRRLLKIISTVLKIIPYFLLAYFFYSIVNPSSTIHNSQFFKYLQFYKNLIVTLCVLWILLRLFYYKTRYNNNRILYHRILEATAFLLSDPDINKAQTEPVNKEHTEKIISKIMEHTSSIGYHSSFTWSQLVSLFEAIVIENEKTCISSWLLLPDPKHKYFKTFCYQTYHSKHNALFRDIKAKHKPKFHNNKRFETLLKKINENTNSNPKDYNEEMSKITSASGYMAYDANSKNKDCVTFVVTDIDSEAIYFNHDYLKYLKPEHHNLKHRTMIAYTFRITGDKYGLFFVFSNYANFP